MLKFTTFTDKAALPPSRRMVYRGCREFVPMPTDRFSGATKDTLERNLTEINAFPAVLVWEKFGGEMRYTLVEKEPIQ